MKFVQVERSCAEDGLGVLEAVPPPQIRPLSPITKGKEGGQEDREDLEKTILEDVGIGESFCLLSHSHYLTFQNIFTLLFDHLGLGIIDHRLFYSTK